MEDCPLPPVPDGPGDLPQSDEPLWLTQYRWWEAEGHMLLWVVSAGRRRLNTSRVTPEKAYRLRLIGERIIVL